MTLIPVKGVFESTTFQEAMLNSSCKTVANDHSDNLCKNFQLSCLNSWNKPILVSMFQPYFFLPITF